MSRSYGTSRQIKVWGSPAFVHWVDQTADTLRIGPSDLIAMALEELAHAKSLKLPPERLYLNRRLRSAAATTTPAPPTS
jgi:hypothetical protein